MARASATAENNALTGLVTGALFFGLNSADPGTTGASEISGGSPAYARVSISWGSPSAGSIANTGALTLNVPASTTVDFFSSWGAVSGTGNGGYQIGGALGSTIVFTTQGVLVVAIGALALAAA